MSGIHPALGFDSLETLGAADKQHPYEPVFAGQVRQILYWFGLDQYCPISISGTGSVAPTDLVG